MNLSIFATSNVIERYYTVVFNVDSLLFYIFNLCSEAFLIFQVHVIQVFYLWKFVQTSRI